jgi:SOUL heme-binding protein
VDLKSTVIFFKVKVMLFRALLLLIIFFSKLAMAIEEPKYIVSEQEPPFEIRQYEPVLIAEVFVEGNRDEASNKGFRMIADFIFGNNESTQKESQKIAMTAPVVVEPITDSKKIAMTAPVTIEQSEDKAWRVQFVMPKEYSIDTLPKPKNPLVKIREVPSKYFAVMTFSGLNNAEKIENNTKLLKQWLVSKNIQAIGTPQLARYNPPWTLPPWRRNEILIEIEAQSK